MILIGLLILVMTIPAWYMGRKKVEWNWLNLVMPPLSFSLWMGLTEIVQRVTHQSKSLSNFAVEVVPVQLLLGILAWLRVFVPKFHKKSYAMASIAIIAAVIVGVCFLVPPLPE